MGSKPSRSRLRMAPSMTLQCHHPFHLVSQHHRLYLSLRIVGPRLPRSGDVGVIGSAGPWAPHQSYDQAYMPPTLALPYNTAHGTKRPLLLRDLQHLILDLELNRPLLLLL
ncbi:hypothetical protein AAG906_016937 [Vitis piasezkii]